MNVEIKIDGRTIQINTNGFDQSWLDECLRYGVRRKINDTYSSLKGTAKYDACMAMKLEMESGVIREERASGFRVEADPILALAITNAKTDLKAKFKQHFGLTKIAQFAAHEACEKYFKYAGESLVWNEHVVVDYIESQLATGTRNFIREALISLEVVEDVTGEIKLDF